MKYITLEADAAATVGEIGLAQPTIVGRIHVPHMISKRQLSHLQLYDQAGSRMMCNFAELDHFSFL